MTTHSIRSSKIAVSTWIKRLGHAEVGLGLLFGWILSFPLYGPWLSSLAGMQAEFFGLLFLLGHALGLFAAGLYPKALNASQKIYSVLAVSLMVCTLLFWQFNHLPSFSIVIFLYMGLCSAALVLYWADWFAKQPNPWKALVIPMVLSNLVLWCSMLPIARNFGVVLAVLPVLMVYLMRHAIEHLPAESSSPSLSTRWFTIAGLAAFAIATHFVCGLWYKVYALPFIIASRWSGVTDGVLYVTGVLFCWWWLQKTRRPDYIAVLSLSALGLGLLSSQVVSPNIFTSLLASGLLGLGIAAADFFYWCGLWAIAQSMDPRKVFGVGLGFSLLQKIASTLINDLWGLSPGLFALLALVLIFLLLPLMLNFGGRVNALRAQAEEAKQDLELLTETEKKVFALLSTGATDAAISEELLISKHTVKFHVRNVLHKLKAPNRKVLLSRLVQKN